MNFCVAPETKILTLKGYRSIKKLKNKEIKIWNGKKWNKVKILKTKTKRNIFQVVTNRGVLNCADCHKFNIYDMENNIIEKKTVELNIIDRLVDFDLPVIEGSKILKTIKFEKSPTAKYTISSRIEWLNELLNQNICVNKFIERNKKTVSLVMIFTLKQYKLLYSIVLMLQTLGIKSIHNCITYDNLCSLKISNKELIKLIKFGLKINDLIVNEIPNVCDNITMVIKNVKYIKNDYAYYLF